MSRTVQPTSDTSASPTAYNPLAAVRAKVESYAATAPEPLTTIAVSSQSTARTALSSAAASAVTSTAAPEV